MLRALAPTDPYNLYTAACAYAQCVPAVAPGKKPGQLSAQETTTQERYAARAVEVLREAIEKGFKDAAHVKEDTDLDPLRARGDFQKRPLESGAEKEKRGQVVCASPILSSGSPSRRHPCGPASPR
jgi:hypothetical protein